MRIHEVKIDEQWWSRIATGTKTCELRKNDRDYQTGDTLKFEGYAQTFEITHILNAEQCDGLKEGYVILSLKPLKFSK